MRFYTYLFIQVILADSVRAKSKSASLRKGSMQRTEQRELLGKDHFDCDEGCDMSQGSPVCGTDGISYQNECLAWCQNVNIKSIGECSGHNSMTDESYDSFSGVTKDELDRFKEESFVFIAKRNFEGNNKRNTSGPKPNGKGSLDSPSYGKGNSTDDGIVFALRITHEGHEYIAKMNVADMKDMLGDYSSVASRPVGYDDKNSARQLNEDQRGIVGSDTRSKVCLRESCYPYSTIGEFDSPDKQGGCTGTVISKSAVLTAAHCFYVNGMYTDLDSFAPGRYRKSSTAYGRGKTVEPYGIWKAQFKTIFTEWITTQKLRYDIAIIHFHPTLYRGDEDSGSMNIGDLVGYVGIKATTNDSHELQKATVTGYPYDKPHGEMWTSGECEFQAGFDDAITYHNCDSVRGNDGSALLDLDAEVAYGVNIADIPVGEDYPDAALANIGVIINKDNIGLINAVAGIQY